MTDKISEKTSISMSMVGAVIGSLVGGCMWLTTIWYQSNANADQLKIISAKQDKYAEELYQIKSELSEIHLELKRMNSRER